MITLPRTSFHRVWSSLLLVALFLFIITVAWLTRSAFAASSTVKSGEHVLTIFDDGQQRGILTKANTLRDALAEANIALSKDDITEPSLDQKLVSSNYDVTIYRARPILIIDGESRTKVISAYHTGKQIAAQAGITLHDEDNVDIQYSPDVVADGAVERMVIKRATPFTLVLYGKTIASYTQSKTVKDMMSEKAIKLAADDTVSVPQSSTITAGMTVEIWRNGAQTTTVEEPVAFTTQRIQDANQPVGYKNVQTPGKDGTKMVTYQITVKNGVPVSKQAIQEVVTQQPVAQVEVVGAKMTNTFSGSFAEALTRLRACEAGGAYDRNSGNGYYGAYQYDVSTWANYGGFKYASDVPGTVQDQKVWETYQRRGWSPWPVCGAQRLQDIYR